MKKFAVIFLLLNFFAICSLSAEEQSSENFKKIEWSLLWGIGSNQVNTDEPGAEKNLEALISGFSGVGSEYRFNKIFSIAPQGYFIVKSYSLKYSYSTSSLISYSISGNIVDNSVFFEVPVLAKFSYNFKNSPNRLYFALGPQISFLVSHSTTFPSGISFTSSQKETIEKAMKPVSVSTGLVCAIGISFRKFLIEIRADQVLNDIIDDSSDSYKDTFTSVDLTLGYIF